MNTEKNYCDGYFVETVESPFFTHFHKLFIPREIFYNPPKDGVKLKTSVLDAESYDTQEFNSFIASSTLNPKSLLNHQHDVLISYEQLLTLREGKKDTEIRVISPSGNFVHSFTITLPQLFLAALKKYKPKVKI